MCSWVKVRLQLTLRMQGRVLDRSSCHTHTLTQRGRTARRSCLWKLKQLEMNERNEALCWVGYHGKELFLKYMFVY